MFCAATMANSIGMESIMLMRLNIPAVFAAAAFKAEGDMKIGVDIIKRALEEPLRTIANNAGLEGSIVVEKVRELKQDMGFNALTEKYEDMIKAGILDPTKVVRIALQNAASIAGLLLTTEGLITDVPDDDKGPKYPMPPGGGGDMY